MRCRPQWMPGGNVSGRVAHIIVNNAGDVISGICCVRPLPRMRVYMNMLQIDTGDIIGRWERVKGTFLIASFQTAWGGGVKWNEKGVAPSEATPRVLACIRG